MTPNRIPFPFTTLNDLLTSLGGVSLARVWLKPAPGSATARDVGYVVDRHNRPVELVDATLVLKATSLRSSAVAMALSSRLIEWNDRAGNLGVTVGASAPVQLTEGVVRISSVSFVFWDRFPGRVIPDVPVTKVIPNLAVEVLSEDNTRAEMERKLKEYFLSEVQLVWFIDPLKRTVRVFTSPDDVVELSETDTLDSGSVLPGFTVEVARLFDQLTPAPKPAKPTKPSAKKPKKQK